MLNRYAKEDEVTIWLYAGTSEYTTILFNKLKVTMRCCGQSAGKTLKEESSETIRQNLIIIKKDIVRPAKRLAELHRNMQSPQMRSVPEKGSNRSERNTLSIECRLARVA